MGLTFGLFTRSDVRDTATEIQTIDISNSLAIDTYTLNHTESKNFFDLTDGSSSTYKQWSSALAALKTTTIIFDLGTITKVHSTMYYYKMEKPGGSSSSTSTLTVSHSKDKVSWTEMSTESKSGTTYSEEYENYAALTKYRYLKFVLTTTNDAIIKTTKIFRIRLIKII